LAESGISVSGITPRRVTADDLTEADVVVTLVPDLDLPIQPTGRLIGWSLPDPAAWDLDGIRPLRDEISHRVIALAAELQPS
jgi:protein-tyrosine-phosphatase